MFIRKTVLYVIILLFNLILLSESVCKCGYGSYCGRVKKNCLCKEISGGLYVTPPKPTDGCSELVDYCKSSPCKNGGTCHPSFGSFSCSCTPGYHGHSCNLHTDPSSGKKFVQTVSVHYDYHEIEDYYNGISFFIIMKEKGENTMIEVDDGNGALIHSPFYPPLKSANPYQLCKQVYNEAPDDLDPKLCDLLTSETSFVLKIKLKYPFDNEDPTKMVKDDNGTVIGRKDIVTVTIKSDNQEQYSQKYPIFTPTNLNKRPCTMALTLQGCGPDYKSPVVYFAKQDIVIRSTTAPLHTKCKFVTDMTYSWLTTGYRSTTFYTHNSRGPSHRQYDGKRLLAGLFTVELTLSVLGSPSAGKAKKRNVNIKKCWFQIIYEKMIAKIRYGSRRVVQVSTPVTLDASVSYDPNFEDIKKLNFTWSCKSKESFCKEITKKDPVRELKKLPLGTFEFFLTVSHKVSDIPSVQTSQIIEVIDKPVIEDLELKCQKNCENARVYEYTYLQLKNIPPGKKPIWTYTKDGGAETSADSIRMGNTPDDVFIIKENALERQASYKIKAQIDNTCNEIQLTTVTPPIKQGNCEVNPKKGERGSTLFDITCSGFKPGTPDGEPLRYDIYQQVVSPSFSKEFDNFLLSSANTPNRVGLQLIHKEVIIKISNYFGDNITEVVNVELSEPVLDKKEMTNLALKVQDNIRNGEIEKALATVFVMADYLNATHTRYSARSTVINTVIENIAKIPLLQEVDAEEVAVVLHYLLYQSIMTEMKVLQSTSFRTTAKVLRNITTNIKDLYAKASFVDTESVKGLLRTLAGCVSLLIYSKNRLLSNKSIDLEQYQYTYNRYLSAANDIIKTIDGYSYMMFQYMVPCQQPIRIVEKVITTHLEVDTMEKLVEKSIIDPSKKKTAYIKFDENVDDSYKDKFIDVQVTHFKKNLFWWFESTLPMDSEHLNIVLRVHNGSRIDSLKYPLHIFMNVTSTSEETLNGEVTQPDPSLPAVYKDLLVKVYRLERNEAGAKKFFVECLNMSDTELDIVILIDEYPDYDKVRNQGKTLSSEDYIYESVPLDDVRPDSMLYLGILPNLKHSVGESVPFNCTVHDQVCRIWSKNSWSIQDCEIGKESTHYFIQCSCTHLSMFGATLLVPPNQLHPIRDIMLLINLKDNPYVLAFVLLLLLIYLALFIWAWRMDRKDKHERIVRVLVDNFPGESCGYLMAVFTGELTMSGTTAHVGVKICGSRSESHSHILNHEKDVLQLAQDNWFIIFTEKYLGDIKCLRVWHDNYGSSPDWYCKKIVIYDLKTKDKYLFLINKWLSVYHVEKNWRLEWVLVPAKLQETDWQYLARDNFFLNIRELHLWVSIFVRHPRTAYTRIQRLTVAMCIIMISMLLAIMFYGAVENIVADDPSYSVRTREIVIAIQCLLISAPVSLLVGALFKFSRKKPMKRNNKNKKRRKRKRTMLETMSKLVKSILTLDPLMPVELSEGEAPESAKDSKKRKIILIMAWTLSFIIIFGCSLYLVLYGLKIGPNKSIRWVSVTLLRLGQTIFIVQPIRVVVYALLFTLLFKEYNRNQMLFSIEYKNIDHALKEDSNYMANLMELRSKPMYYPLSQLDVMRLTKKRMRTEQQKWRILNFIFVSALFFSIWILTTGSNYSVVYYNTEHLSELIRTPASITDFDIDEVYNRSRFFEYTIHSLLPSLHVTQWYNGMDLPIENEEMDLPPSKWKGWTNDFSSKILGVPRLRQLRITKGTCYVPEEFQPFFQNCNSSFSTSVQDKATYAISWSPASSDEKHWFYSSAETSETIGMYGATGYYYPGGGYIRNLTKNMVDSSEEIIKLKIEKWFDELTRAIFIEFNLYNANSNLLSQVTIIVENLASGVIATRVYIDTVYHKFYLETLDIPSLIALIFFIVILILSLLRIVLHVSMEGMGPFFNSCGNFLDILILFFGFSCVIATFVRDAYFKLYSDAYERAANEEYISFVYPFYQDDVESILLSILTVITTIRILQLAYYGKWYYILCKTIKQSWPYIACILALIFFFTSLISEVAYITEMQNHRMYYTLMVPKINFIDHQEYREMNILFKVALNLIYLVGGMMITAVSIVFYAKSKFHFNSFQRVENYNSNHFVFLFKHVQRGLKTLFKDDIALRIQQGTATKDDRNKYRRNLYDATKLRIARDFKLEKLEAEDIMIDFYNEYKRHKKMCDQLDQILESIE